MRSVRPRNSGTAPASIPLFRAYFASQRVQSSGIHSTTPTTLSRSENATTRERNAISTACRNCTRDGYNRAIGQHHPETKKEQWAQRTTPTAWGEKFANCGIQPHQVYRPPLAKCNPTIYSATPQPTHKFCYPTGSGIRPITHTGLHFLANSGYTIAG
jgi:hypothetical protein